MYKVTNAEKFREHIRDKLFEIIENRNIMYLSAGFMINLIFVVVYFEINILAPVFYCNI